MMLKLIKRFFPPKLLCVVRPWYHGFLAVAAHLYYGRPSERMIVVGITGTAGKSTTTHLLAHILNSAGMRTGFITTVDFFDGEKVYINKHGLSMPNEVLLQRQLHAMARNGCKVAIVEATSEGLAQNRHWGINFDVALVTNVSRAHLDAHGGFDNYRAAKGKLFAALQAGKRKLFFPKKIAGVNLDNAEHGYFLSFPADTQFGITLKETPASVGKMCAAVETPQGFLIDGHLLELRMPGQFNIYNALLAISCASCLGVGVGAAVGSLERFNGVPGRMEAIENNKGFKVIVDYGCEPASIRAALMAANQLPHRKIIHVFGTTGGHRDIEKRFVFGRASAELADVSIITNDDVYESDPQKIAADIESGIKGQEPRKSGHTYQVILDRREAIRRALATAQPNDIVLITGKGSEQFLVLPGNRRIPWDEREVVREEIQKLELSS